MATSVIELRGLKLITELLMPNQIMGLTLSEYIFILV